MRTSTGRVLGLALAAAAAVACPLFAAGTIQSLKVAPNPSPPNQDVLITIGGAGGPCRALLVFGEGQTAPITIATFPNVTRHRYPAAGMFMVRVSGRPGLAPGETTGSAPPACSGAGEVNLTVAVGATPAGGGGTPAGGSTGAGSPGGSTGGTSGGGTSGGGTSGGGSSGGGSSGGGSSGGGTSGGGATLARAGLPSTFVAPTKTPTPSGASAGGPPSSALAGAAVQPAFSSQGIVALDLNSPTFQALQHPTITKLADDSQPTPGGAIGVIGTGFGTWTVNRRLILKTGGKQVDLQIVHWGDKAAAGTVPDGFGGVPDGPGTIQLVNGIKAATNEMALNFTAARETVEVTKRAVGIRGCYNGGMSSTCNGWTSDNTGGVQDLDSAPSVYVYHACTHWDFFHTGDDGGDTFEVQLKNGWVMEDAKVEKACGGGDLNYSGNCYLIEKLTWNVVGKGKPIGSVQLGWHVPRLYQGVYLVHFYATGPAGTPYQ